MPDYKALLHRMRSKTRISRTDLKRSTRVLKTPKRSRSLSPLNELLFKEGGLYIPIQRSAKKPATVSKVLIFPTSRYCPFISKAFKFCCIYNVICL